MMDTVGDAILFCSDNVGLVSRLACSYMRRYGRWLGDFIQSSLPPCELPAFPWIASPPPWFLFTEYRL